MPDAPVPPAGSGESRGRVLGCFALLLVALHITVGPRVRLGEWTVRGEDNGNYAEALAWHDGRLDLSHRLFDSAMHDGRVYNIYPPLFSFVSYATIALQHRQGVADDPMYRPWYVALVALPLPVVGFWAWRRMLGDSVRAAAMTFVWIAGTPILPLAAGCRVGSMGSVNQLLSQTGIMLLLGARGPQFKTGVASLGLLIAAWTRPAMLALAVPVLIEAWAADPRGRMRRVAGVASVVGGAAAVLLLLNWLKFGSPWESGHGLIYAGRDDDLARRAAVGVFSWLHVPRNAWYMFVECPSWRIDAAGFRLMPDSDGASIWLATPLLLYALVDARRWWRDGRRRLWMFASMFTLAIVLTYHCTGYVQPGYYRYALDFVPVWLAMSADGMWGGRRTRWTIAAMAWSCLYFNLLPY